MIRNKHNSSPDQMIIDKAEEEEDKASVSFLLEEFKRLHDLYLRQRVKRGERVNFFIGLSTAAGTGIIIANQIGIISPYNLQWLGLILLALLGIFGVSIHGNLVMNDINSENYLRGINKITRYFVERDNNLAGYLLFPDTTREPSIYIKFRLSSVRSVIQILTAILFSGAAFIALSFFFQPIPIWLGAVTVITVLVIVVFCLHFWATRQHRKAVENYKYSAI